MNPLYDIIGFVYLWLRYRNPSKVRQIRKEYYEDSYYVAGGQLFWSAFGIVLFILLAVLLFAVIYAIFKHGPSAP